MEELFHPTIILHPLTLLADSLIDIYQYWENITEWYNLATNPLGTVGQNIWEQIKLQAIDTASTYYTLFYANIILQTLNIAVTTLDWSLNVSISNSILVQGWSKSIFVVNLMAIFSLIALAFANALRLNIETYEIKKTLPSLIIGFVLANLSLLLINALLDFSEVLSSGIKDIFHGDSINFVTQLAQMTTGVKYEMGTNGQIIPIDASNSFLQQLINNNWIYQYDFYTHALSLNPLAIVDPIKILATGLIALTAVFVPTIIILIIALVALARHIAIFIFVAIAPISIMLYSFPATKSHGQTLIQQLLMWIFLAPAIIFCLGLSSLFDLSESAEPLFHKTASSFMDIAYAIEPNADFDRVFQQFFLFAAGITILIAALYLPFRIGGIGQSIINGFGNLFKRGINLGKFGLSLPGKGIDTAYKTGRFVAGDKFWPGLTQHLPKPLQDIIGEVGRLRVASTKKYEKVSRGRIMTAAEKRSAVWHKKHDQARIAANEAKAKGDTDEYKRQIALAKEYGNKAEKEDNTIEEAMSKSAYGVLVEKGTIPQVAELIKGLQSGKEWEKFKNGEAVDGTYLEKASNFFQVLRRWANYPTQFPDKADDAKAMLDQWESMGFGFDGYLNFRYLGDSYKKPFENPKSNLHLAESVLRDGGLEENEIQKIRTASTPTEISQIIGSREINPTSQYDISKVYNDASMASLNDVATHYNSEVTKSIGASVNKFASVLNTASDKILTQVNDSIKRKNYSEAMETAQQHNLTPLVNAIKNLPRDYYGKVRETSMQKYTLQNSINQLITAQQHIDSNINPNINIASVIEKTYGKDSPEQKIANNLQYHVDVIKTYKNHNAIKMDVNASSNTTIEDKIRTIISSNKADDSYITESIPYENIAAEIVKLRKDYNTREGKMGLSQPEQDKIMDKLRSLDTDFQIMKRRINLTY
ncbi:hypothetical protein KJ855_01190 [Patescibacteria group bacterium]|nr:hypothetical protein [Patescibacteria group bacterium]